MELKRRFDAKIVFIIVFCLAFLTYLLVGLLPARATEYNIDGSISIPRINLSADVTNLKLENGQLNTPDTIVGSFTKSQNKTLLIGHSSTVFADLRQTKLGDLVQYNEKTYQVVERKILKKNNVSMGELLRGENEDTIILMTCAGKDLGAGDASHRLIIRAVEK